MNPTQPGGDGDALRALDERIGRLVARLRDVVAERDALLRDVDELRSRAAGFESVAERGTAMRTAWREGSGQVEAVLRLALEELRAD